MRNFWSHCGIYLHKRHHSQRAYRQTYQKYPNQLLWKLFEDRWVVWSGWRDLMVMEVPDWRLPKITEVFFFLISESTDSALQMFTDGVDEFFKCFMESINSVLINEGQDKNVSFRDEFVFEIGLSFTIRMYRKPWRLQHWKRLSLKTIHRWRRCTITTKMK